MLSFYIVDTKQEVIRLANVTKFGLGTLVFGTDIKYAKEVASQLESSILFINSYIYSGLEVLFGGIKNSGFG